MCRKLVLALLLILGRRWSSESLDIALRFDQCQTVDDAVLWGSCRGSSDAERMSVAALRPLSKHLHQDERNHIDPDCGIAQPSQSLQTANASRYHADDHDDDHTHHETNLVLGHLVQDLRLAKKQYSHTEELLDRLCDVDEMPSVRTVDTEETENESAPSTRVAFWLAYGSP